MSTVDTQIQNLPARLRGQTNKLKYGAGSPMTIVNWLRSEAQHLENKVRAEAMLKQQLKIGGE